MKPYRIETLYTLLQPLSHIGESESTQSFLNTTTIVSDGVPEEVFCYTGNAIRGALRDAGAVYLLEKLGVQLPPEQFNLLFSGGSIGGTQSVDIDQARLLRKSLPLISLFGGGVGNQLLRGIPKQTFAYPICRETNGILPAHLPKSQYSWRQYSGVKEFTRTDDSKNAVISEQYLLGAADQLLLTGEEKKKKDGPATQMRYGVEYMAPGVQLYHRWDLVCEEVELGAFVSAVYEWRKQPYLGGMGGKGFGLVDAEMTITFDGQKSLFIDVKQDVFTLGAAAERAKKTYDQHLQDMYDQYIESNGKGIVQLLEGQLK